MNRARKTLILKQLKHHNIMSLATVRADGYPQATTVGYANDGLDLYFCCDRVSQDYSKGFGHTELVRP